MNAETLQTYQGMALFTMLLVCWTLDSLFPYFGKKPQNFRHGLTNLGLLVLFILVNGLLGSLYTGLALWVQTNKLGLLHWVDLPLGWSLAVGVVLMDLVGYGAHVLKHKVPFLWRFHQVHHSDADLDATSAFRFHPAEAVVNLGIAALTLPLTGVSPLAIALYFLLISPLIVLQHANLALPTWLDKALSWVISTPNVHKLHHSDYQPETDSNFSDGLTMWDRAFGTFRYRTDLRQVGFGLEQFPRHKAVSLWNLLKLPFLSNKP